MVFLWCSAAAKRLKGEANAIARWVTVGGGVAPMLWGNSLWAAFLECGGGNDRREADADFPN